MISKEMTIPASHMRPSLVKSAPRAFLKIVASLIVGPDVFISYSRRDAFDYAANLAALLLSLA